MSIILAGLTGFGVEEYIWHRDAQKREDAKEAI